MDGGRIMHSVESRFSCEVRQEKKLWLVLDKDGFLKMFFGKFFNTDVCMK